MLEFFRKLFSNDFMPHGVCYRWQPDVVWMQAVSNALIGLAYYSIPLGLMYFVRKRSDLAFKGLFRMFGIFIFACGTTHLMEVWTLWHPTYRLDALLRLLTAAVSVTTAVALVTLIPHALALPSPAQLEVANQQLQRLASIVQSSSDAIFTRNLDGFITTWNQGAEMLFGYRAAEAIGQHFMFLVPEDRRAEATANAVQMAGMDSIAHFELERVRKDGKRIEVSAAASPIFDVQGRMVELSFICRDITAQKQAEAQVRKLNEELERRVAERTAELQRSNAELEQFAYVASHDLQEPLRMVSSFTQLLAKRYQGRLGQDADEFIGFAVDGVTRMRALINDLLAYSRLDRRGRVVQPVDAEQAFQRALSNLRLAVQDAGAAVTHDPLPTVNADEVQLVQLFQNLVGNALKYSSPDREPRIQVSARQEGEEWVFSVQDNGIGIEPTYHERIFVVFKRLHGPEYPGTGMGLAICKKIVEGHGGRIWVESEAGRGSTFLFSLPAA